MAYKHITEAQWKEAGQLVKSGERTQKEMSIHLNCSASDVSKGLISRRLIKARKISKWGKNKTKGKKTSKPIKRPLRYARSKTGLRSNPEVDTLVEQITASMKIRTALLPGIIDKLDSLAQDITAIRAELVEAIDS